MIRHSKRGSFRKLSCLLATICSCGIIIYLCHAYKQNKIFGKEGYLLDAAASSRLDSIREECAEMCSTKECVATANYLLGVMDESADPCEDAFAIACGRFESFRPDNDLQQYTNHMYEELLITTKGVLDNIEDSPSSPAGKLKTVYDSCINETSSEVNAMTSLKKFLDRLGIHHWPNLDQDFHFNRPSLEETVAMYASHGDILVGYSTGFPFRDYMMPLLKVTLHDPLVSGELTRDNLPYEEVIYNTTDTGNSINFQKILKVSEGMKRSIHELLHLGKIEHYIGANIDSWKTILKDFKRVDKTLWRSIENNETANETNSNKVRQLNCTTDVEKELVFVCDVLKLFVKQNHLENAYSQTVFEIFDVAYLRKLNNAFTNLPHRTLANYIAVQVLLQTQDTLDVFFKVSSHTRSPITKWKQCVDWTIDHLRPLLRQEYVTQVIGKDSDNVRKIIDFYIGIAAFILKKEHWLEDNLRQNISERIQSHMNKLQHSIEALAYSRNIEIVYKKYEPAAGSFFLNAMDLRLHYTRQSLLNTEILGSRDIYTRHNPFAVNAYNQRRIGLHLMFGMLLPPVYQSGRPNIMNFASLGEIVGHEVGHEIHGFYFIGDNYIVDNNTKDKFKEKEDCINEQYSTIEINDIKMKVNGSLMVKENVADLIGMQLTEKMVEMFLEEQGEGGKFALPALNYTYQQLISISISQFFCSKTPKKESDIIIYSHAAPFMRTQVKSKNSRKYSEAFQCAPGSRMNPVHKCTFFERI